MKESYGEGLASHTDPESCTVGRKAEREALTGARAGRVLNCETETPPQGGHFGVPTLIEASGRPHRRRRERETSTDPARSKTPCMYGYISDGNREILGVSALRGHADRIGKS
jgi:RNA-directed DNA polymerase